MDTNPQKNEKEMNITTAEQPQVTVGVISYNGKNVIKECLDSILAQTYENFQIFLINNSSTDGTPEWVAEQYPSVKILTYPENNGPNPARNMAIVESPNDLVLLVDDDAILEKNCLSELVSAAKAYPDSAIWAPRIVYNDQRDLIQLEGARMHYVSETILESSDIPITEGMKEITQVDMVAGITLLVSQKAALKIGLFDEYYFFGRDDGEFAYRLTQAGWAVYTVPTATSYHRVKKRGFGKLFYQIRNRWVLMLTTFSIKTMILIIPALIVYEISLIVYLLVKGKLAEYLRATFNVFSSSSIILERRKTIQNLRKIPDKEIIHNANINMRGDLVENKAIALFKASLDGFFSLYWKLIYRFI